MNSTQETQTLSEASAVRLFNSVAVTSDSNAIIPIPAASDQQSTMGSQNSMSKLGSMDGMGNLCRICRWNRSDFLLLQSPCLCKGTVGSIHLQCLKRWILHRRNTHCEICNAPFILPLQKQSFRQMLNNFFTKCFGSISKQIIFGASLLPLGQVILHQVFLCMETINNSPEETLSISEILVASYALLTSSALFFHFSEYITTRILMIHNILRQWWTFGDNSDFPFIQPDSEIFDFF
ncbi:uncharacterized protein LOC142230260 [Haematobia irritans]|uniref:uncharacterized protein LOC142230260 n=1 Tax=Haematobia irritans TaxID=7368 RepID=UPI003F4F408A